MRLSWLSDELSRVLDLELLSRVLRLLLLVLDLPWEPELDEPDDPDEDEDEERVRLRRFDLPFLECLRLSSLEESED